MKFTEHTVEENQTDPEIICARAEHLACAGSFSEAQDLLTSLLSESAAPNQVARAVNNLGVLSAVQGQLVHARQQFRQAIQLNPGWSVPRDNLAKLAAPNSEPDSSHRASPWLLRPNLGHRRVAIVSLLFNWPSTGGGTVHTAETARFLTGAGYDVLHISLRHDPWALGQINDAVDWPLLELAFTESDWNLSTIQSRIRQTVDAFSPDAVIVTDSWSMKPRLAEALSGQKVYLRLAAQECLCPLNNVRLLSVQPQPESCPRHQLATPDTCRQCVADRQSRSGLLHRLERGLAEFDHQDYQDVLRQAFANAAGVLVVNPLIGEMVKPYTRAAHVIPSGFDPARFPWTTYRDDSIEDPRIHRILFAGLPEEPMKGFVVLEDACQQLWNERRDFRLVVTAEAPGSIQDFSEYVGWQTQTDLPQRMREADIVVCPTIAQEALGRTAVEAMGAWRPVVASRIGGLPFTVLDEATGLLCEPGDSNDLSRKLRRLLDDPALREQLGRRGRQRFEERYSWPAIIRRYVSLLGEPVLSSSLEHRRESTR